jgi:two-component system nitrogen regulation sensor histidine kinase GlnL
MDPLQGLDGVLVEYLATGILLLDSGLHVEYMNPAAEQLLGRSRQQAVHAPLVVGLPQLAQLVPLLERAAKTGDVLAQLELTVEDDSDGTLTIDCNVSQIDEGQRDTRLLVEMSDASRRLRINREAALLSQRDASRSIVRQLAHEVRNPLGGIRGAAQLLERELSEAEHLEFTQLVIREADRLAALVDGLLGPGEPPMPEDVNIHEILEHIFQLSRSAASPELEIERDYDPSLPMVRLDRSQVIQALLNLVRNALEAVGEQGKVTLRTRALTHHTIGSKLHRLVACVEIEDSGRGVPDEIRETLFYPLVTGRRDGTGLGLALAQDLVSRQGGLIEFSSRPGRTVFQVLFPIQDDER